MATRSQFELTGRVTQPADPVHNLPEQVSCTTTDLQFAGDYTIDRGAKLIIRPDGNANWIATVRSTDTNDTAKISFVFLKDDGTETFPGFTILGIHIPHAFTVAELHMDNSNTWYGWGTGFTFDPEYYPNMAQVAISWEC
jgi:hypothetical protein